MNNNIILVHGFLGWGNDEYLDFYYWGGPIPLSTTLNNMGFKVFTPTVGFASSNWDRACELYAYIVGGTVDYGLAHSKKYHHNRYGSTYKGLGEKFNENNMIHLIGHSMGGQTVRLLAYLLENGSSREREASIANISPLFLGGNNFIKSITTICTPHDGSIFDDVSGNLESYISSMLSYFPEDKKKSFIKTLDSWGIKRSFNIEGYKDTGIWDLCTQGASELNKAIKISENIYYLTISCEAFNGLGHDGLVNIHSAIGPHKGCNDKIVNYDNTLKKGVYNYLGNIRNTNHGEIVFLGDEPKRGIYIEFYRSLIELLLKL